MGAGVVVLRFCPGLRLFGFGRFVACVTGAVVVKASSNSESGVMTICWGFCCGNISLPPLPKIAGKIIDQDDDTSGVSSMGSASFEMFLFDSTSLLSTFCTLSTISCTFFSGSRSSTGTCCTMDEFSPSPFATILCISSMVMRRFTNSPFSSNV